MKRFSLLFHRYIVRDLMGEPRRTLLTLLGVALGIGVVVAVHQSSDRAVGSFSRSLRVLSGSADYQITNNGLPLSEDLLRELLFLWDWGEVTPLIEGRVRLPGSRLVINVYGIDLLGDGAFRDHYTSQRERIGDQVQLESFLSLLSDPRALILPSSLADRLQVELGDEITLMQGDREWTGRVASIVRDAGAANAFGGNLLFLDLAAAQNLLQKVGQLDRIEFKLADGAPTEDLLSRVRRIIPETAFLRESGEAVEQSDKMLRAFRYNLTALSYLSLIVGVILIYNTLNLAAVRRRREVAALRTLGASRELVLGLFLSESMLLGGLGSVGGLWLGQVMGGLADSLVRRTVETLYLGFSLRPLEGDGSGFFYAMMLALGALLGLVSGAIPSLRVSSVSPVQVLREGFLIGDRHAFPRCLVWIGIGLIGLGAAIAQVPASGNVPIGGYISAVLLICGFGLVAPELSGRLLSLLRLARAAPGIEGRLALDSVERGLPRLVVAVISLGVAVSLLVSIFVMVGSFRRTVIAWIDQTFRADLYISAAGTSSSGGGERGMAAGFVAAIQAIDGVRAVGSFRGHTIEYGGIPVTLAGTDLGTRARNSKILFVDGSDTSQVVQRVIGRDAVIVSEPFALKQRVQTGQQIFLPTPAGPAPFLVEGIYYDYSSDRGLILMDQSSYWRHFQDRSLSNLAVYINGDEHKVDEIRQKIGENLSEAHLFIARNTDLRRQALRIFDQTFRITYALELVAIAVAVLGITNTLGTLILERRGEIAIFKFLGADRRQLRRITLNEALLTGVLGLTLGCLLGMGLALVLIYVINRQAFGWTIQFDPPWISVLLALAGVLAATVLSGLYPARLATQTDPIRSLRAE